MHYLTESELNVASRFLFLSMTIIVIEQDKEHLQKGAFKIKEPYLQLLNQMISEAKQERQQLRKIISEKNMQIISLDQNETISSYLFICQGREQKRHYFNPVIRQKVKEMIYELMGKAQLVDFTDPFSESTNS